MLRLVLSLVLLSIIHFDVLSQTPVKQDTTSDSLKIYHKIQDFAHRKKLYKFLFKKVFRMPQSQKIVEERCEDESCEDYRNRIIRNIDVITLEPFGYSVYDTSRHQHSFIQKAGNVLHQRSTKLTIKNQLLIKKNTPLDPVKLTESERIIRQASYVRDVVFRVIPVRGTKDSVDVLIIEQDLFSKGVGLGFTPSKQTLLVKERNFLGLSHYIVHNTFFYPERDKFISEGSYTIPYLRNTFITAAAYYSNDTRAFTRGFTANRPFYSYLTKVAGGVDYLSHGSTGSIVYPGDSSVVTYGVRFNDLDIWAGRSFALYRHLTPSPNFVISGRYLNRHYFRKPPLAADSLGRQNDSRLYLLGFGISHRLYYRDRYIYRYGTPEDVPAGKKFAVYIGYEDGPLTGRMYSGVELATGRYRRWLGYLTASTGYATYTRDLRLQESVAYGSLGYISNLVSIQTWKLRQFVKAQCTYGIFRSRGESLSIYNGNGIRGLSGAAITGTNKLTLNFQSQLYLPYDVAGFRFAPFFFAAFGMLGNDDTPFYEQRVYQGYGLGLLVKNELLVIGSFQFSFGFYPHVPGEHSMWKFNPVKTYDLTFRDFDISKPGLIAYE
jgi:hypothetical protein